MNIAPVVIHPCLVILALFTSVNLAHADAEEPKVELGVGIGGQFLADYRGSKDYQFNAIPIPYVVYHGDFFESGRDGVRGKIFRSDNLEFNISADAALASDSDDNKLREGMPEIHPTFELGPSLDINLTGSLDSGFSLKLPARGVFAYDGLDVNHVGWLFNPHLSFKNPEYRTHYKLSYSIGALFADSNYHDYYYGIGPQYQSTTRAAYDAEAGYNGAYFKVGLSRRIGQWWLGSYLRYDTLYGAKIEDSPLVETDHYFSIGVAVSWVLWKSKTSVGE